MLTRRNFLKIAAAGTVTAMWPAWMPRLAFAQDGVQGDVIVCVFLRGGADALNMIVPFGDDAYYAARPTLALAQPDRHDPGAVLELDDFFGLNPDMRALHELFSAGHLTAIHAVGAPHVSRSHFEAMDLIERGTDGEQGASSGWLGRYLTATAGQGDSPLRAVGWGDNLQTALRGYVSATALRSILDYHVDEDREMLARLAAMYRADPNLDAAAQVSLETLSLVQKVDIEQYRPANDALYAENDFGRALKQTAALIKADAGLEVSCIDLGGFDTHITQGRLLSSGGSFPQLVTNLATNLRAFHDDLLAYRDQVTVVVMSEFGRRVQENGAAGTDHGHGGVMWVLSPNLQPVRVHGSWPGINSEFLENGDLKITTDYRDVLGEILQTRTRHAPLEAVFPGHVLNPVGLFVG